MQTTRNVTPGEKGTKKLLDTTSPPEGPSDSLHSGVLFSPADEMLRRAIAQTLKSPVADRAQLFGYFAGEIEKFVARHYPQRPWTCRVYSGTDGSRIFRGGVGHSLVIDTGGRLWRARSYEDFDTTYVFTNGSCEIETLTPRYSQMSEYLEGEMS